MEIVYLNIEVSLNAQITGNVNKFSIYIPMFI